MLSTGLIFARPTSVLSNRVLLKRKKLAASFLKKTSAVMFVILQTQTICVFSDNEKKPKGDSAFVFGGQQVYFIFGVALNGFPKN